jgi:hypothetical protein
LNLLKAIYAPKPPKMIVLWFFINFRKKYIFMKNKVFLRLPYCLKIWKILYFCHENVKSREQRAKKTKLVKYLYFWIFFENCVFWAFFQTLMFFTGYSDFMLTNRQRIHIYNNKMHISWNFHLNRTRSTLKVPQNLPFFEILTLNKEMPLQIFFGHWQLANRFKFEGKNYNT